jgi:hypothetical protein
VATGPVAHTWREAEAESRCHRPKIARFNGSTLQDGARRDLITFFETRVDNRLWGGGPSLVHDDIAKLAFFILAPV